MCSSVNAHLLHNLITGRPTTTSINLTMNLHGLTLCKDLVTVFQKVGVCIGYAMVLLLRNAWAVHDIQHCEECPDEVSENKPGVVIVDDD